MLYRHRCHTHFSSYSRTASSESMDRTHQTTAERNPLLQTETNYTARRRWPITTTTMIALNAIGGWVLLLSHTITHVSCMLVLNGAPDVHLCALKIQRGATMQWQEWNEHIATYIVVIWCWWRAHDTIKKRTFLEFSKERDDTRSWWWKVVSQGFALTPTTHTHIHKNYDDEKSGRKQKTAKGFCFCFLPLLRFSFGHLPRTN